MKIFKSLFSIADRICNISEGTALRKFLYTVCNIIIWTLFILCLRYFIDFNGSGAEIIEIVLYIVSIVFGIFLGIESIICVIYEIAIFICSFGDLDENLGAAIFNIVVAGLAIVALVITLIFILK